MATRNITDCIPQMQQSFEQAVKDYAVKFPNDPQPFLTCCFRDKIAWDLIHFKNFADCIKQYGAHWGGDWNGFKDYPHYEIPRT